MNMTKNINDYDNEYDKEYDNDIYIYTLDRYGILCYMGFNMF